MKAYCLLDGKSIEVERADKYVKSVDETAKFMFRGDSCTIMLTPSYDVNIPHGFKYIYYIVNGELLKTCITDKYEKLKVLYGDVIINEQLSLFS